MSEQQSDKPGRAQRLEISLDGSHACALWGANLHDGEAVFVKIEGWPNASHKQEQAAMREAYELLCKAIGDRLPFDIVRDHLKPSVALPECGTNFIDPTISRDWTTDRQPGAVAVHSCVVDGVLCRWWGDEVPPGVAKISAALSAKRMICSVITGCRTPEFCAANGPKCAPSTSGSSLLSALDAYDEETKRVPLGTNNEQLGASVYNWRKFVSGEIRAMLASVPSARPLSPK